MEDFIRQEKTNVFKSYPVVFKAIIVFFLVIIFMVPTAMIRNLIKERESTQANAIREVSAKWGNNQTLTGPVLSIPYLNPANPKAAPLWAHFLPENLTVNGLLNPEKRYRSIYEVVVYNSKIHFQGNFLSPDFAELKIPRQSILFDDAVINLGITDLRGLEEQIQIQWNADSTWFNPGVLTNDVMEDGINAKVKIPLSDSLKSYDFKFDITLKGSEILYFVPVGKETRINMKSGWQNPSFDGAFLPDTRTINDTGFNADWKILHLNRNFPQSWTGSKHQLKESSFGVNLILMVDHYKKTERSIKYSILLISLTFIVFFFIEVLNRTSINPFQYILIGIALVIYYSLLLSFSEHLSFALAYLISSLMTILLIMWYTSSILHIKRIALLISGTLALLYGFIFTIVQLTDYALLMGSLGLFVSLAIIMYFSRKVDWKNINSDEDESTSRMTNV